LGFVSSYELQPFGCSTELETVTRMTEPCFLHEKVKFLFRINVEATKTIKTHISMLIRRGNHQCESENSDSGQFIHYVLIKSTNRGECHIHYDVFLK
jgi:hypothetical protein